MLPIVAEIEIAAPIEDVWTELTGEASVPLWLGSMNYEARTGTTFHMQPDEAKRASGDISGATHCDVVLLEAPQRFNFSWYVPGTPHTLVQINLRSAAAASSIVRLLHFGWDQFPADAVQGIYDQLKRAWADAVLPSLKLAAERRS